MSSMSETSTMDVPTPHPGGTGGIRTRDTMEWSARFATTAALGAIDVEQALSIKCLLPASPGENAQCAADRKARFTPKEQSSWMVSR
jgi:hypothetical protein